MTQNVKVTFGNISKDQVQERVFDSKNAAFIWLNHQLVREAGLKSVHELYFRVEEYDFDRPNLDYSATFIEELPF